MRKHDLKTLVNVEEVVVDVLQRLIIFLQCLQKDRFRMPECLGHDGVRHGLQHDRPCTNVGSCVWGSQEDKTVGGHIDTTIVLVL